MRRLTLFICVLLIPIALGAKESSSKEVIDTSLVFDRGIGTPSSCFIPKGTKITGVSFAYSTYEAGNFDSTDPGFSFLGSIISGLKGSLNNFSISPSFSYCIRDNISVGARLDVTRTSLNLPSATLGVNDLSFSLNDVNYDKNSYAFALTLRDYIPIMQNNRRFAFFAEGRLSTVYGESKNYTFEEGLKHGSFAQNYGISLGIVPGICVFVTDFAAFEISVGLVGVNYQKTIKTENQVTRSALESSGANFRLNLLDLSFGINYFILDSKHRPAKK